MPSNVKSILLIVLLVLQGCSTDSILLNGIDINLWKSDKNACQGYRSNFIDRLEEEKDNILRFGERDVTLSLGIPERTQLYEKSQKFYFYQLSKGKSCDLDSSTESIVLRLRFTAMGYCNEALILNE